MLILLKNKQLIKLLLENIFRLHYLYLCNYRARDIMYWFNLAMVVIAAAVVALGVFSFYMTNKITKNIKTTIRVDAC